MAIENATLFERSDARLQEQTRRLEALIQSLSDGLILSRPEGTVVYANRRVAELADLAQQELIGTSAEKVLDRILESVGRVVPYDAVYVILLDPDDQIARVVRLRDHHNLENPPDMQGFQFTLSQTRNLREIQATGLPLIISDTRAYEGWVTTPMTPWVCSYLGAPVITKGKTIGFLSLISAKPDAFTPRQAYSAGTVSTIPALWPLTWSSV